MFTPKNSQFLKPQNLLEFLPISIYFSSKLDDKRDTFVFHIANVPFMSSNIASAPTCGVYASQVNRYAHCCSNCSDFLLRHRALVTRLICHRVTKLTICPTHLRNSTAGTQI